MAWSDSAGTCQSRQTGSAGSILQLGRPPDVSGLGSAALDVGRGGLLPDPAIAARIRESAVPSRTQRSPSVRMWGSGRRAKANLWVKHRNRTMVASKPGHTLCLGNSRAGTYLLALWCPVQSRRESDPGFRTELENLVGSVKGKGTSGRTARPKVPMGQAGRTAP